MTAIALLLGLMFHTPGLPCPPEDERPVALILGDSNIYASLGSELEQALQGLGYATERFGRSGSGLARPDYFDWFTQGPALVDAIQPDVVFFMAGGNDGQRLSGLQSGQRPIRWEETRAWAAGYIERVVLLVSLLGGPDRPVIFLSPTNRRPLAARKKVLRVRELQRDALESLSGARWVDMYPLTSDSRGRWLAKGRDAAGRAKALRAHDGIHLTRAGGVEVSGRLVRELIASGLPVFGQRCPRVTRPPLLGLQGRQHAPGRRNDAGPALRARTPRDSKGARSRRGW